MASFGCRDHSYAHHACSHSTPEREKQAVQRSVLALIQQKKHRPTETTLQLDSDVEGVGTQTDSHLASLQGILRER